MRDSEPRAGRHITLMVTQHGGSYQGTVQRSSSIPWDGHQRRLPRELHWREVGLVGMWQGGQPSGQVSLRDTDLWGSGSPQGDFGGD